MKITVYSKPNCQACDLTKIWLDNNNLPYTAIDAYEDADAMAEIQSHGFMSFPVVTVGSFDNAWTGFEIDRLEELL